MGTWFLDTYDMSMNINDINDYCLRYGEYHFSVKRLSFLVHIQSVHWICHPMASPPNDLLPKNSESVTSPENASKNSKHPQLFLGGNVLECSVLPCA